MYIHFICIVLELGWGFVKGEVCIKSHPPLLMFADESPSPEFVVEILRGFYSVHFDCTDRDG